MIGRPSNDPMPARSLTTSEQTAALSASPTEDGAVTQSRQSDSESCATTAVSRAEALTRGTAAVARTARVGQAMQGLQPPGGTA